MSPINQLQRSHAMFSCCLVESRKKNRQVWFKAKHCSLLLLHSKILVTPLLLQLPRLCAVKTLHCPKSPRFKMYAVCWVNPWCGVCCACRVMLAGASLERAARCSSSLGHTLISTQCNFPAPSVCIKRTHRHFIRRAWWSVMCRVMEQQQQSRILWGSSLSPYCAPHV